MSPENFTIAVIIVAVILLISSLVELWNLYNWEIRGNFVKPSGNDNDDNETVESEEDTASRLSNAKGGNYWDLVLSLALLGLGLYAKFGGKAQNAAAAYAMKQAQPQVAMPTMPAVSSNF